MNLPARLNQPANLRTYAALSRLSPFKSYEGKIMVIAFLGTHVPLLTLLAFFLVIASPGLDVAVRVLVVALVATLAGAATTLITLHKLLAPITLTYDSLRDYLTTNRLPELPTQYTDEAGKLMANTQYTIGKLDGVIQHLSSYDNLTGLPNRSLFVSQLAQALHQTDVTGQSVAVLGTGHRPTFRISTMPSGRKTATSSSKLLHSFSAQSSTSPKQSLASPAPNLRSCCPTFNRSPKSPSVRSSCWTPWQNP